MLDNKKINKLGVELMHMLDLGIEDLETINAYLKRAYDMNANVLHSIQKAKVRAEQKGWDYTYWFFDLHETIIIPNYTTEEIPKEFYPDAKETLQMISKRSDIKMHIYTCSWPGEIEKYNAYFKENDIHFDFLFAKNPEVTNEALGFYENKPYFNVLFEDKAGFDPSYWKYVKEYLEENPDPNTDTKQFNI
jgi:hypothetical protein